MQSIKSLLITLLILGGAFLAYDYYLAPAGEKMVFKKVPATNPDTKATPTSPTVTEAVTKPAESVTPPPSAPEVPVAPITSAPPPPVPTPAEAGKVADGFVPPAIPDVARATDNWLRIPASAFPRPVKLRKPIAFKASFGASQVPAGSEVTAMSARDGVLTVAPNAQSALRATVEMDATDLKPRLTVIYDAWRTKRIEAARQAWETHKNAPVETNVPLVASNGKPELGPDGTYPLLMASMRSGQVTEVTPASITKWGPPEEADFKGQHSWIVTVDFDSQTAFGKISSTAVAQIINGKVAGWFYKGSGESVP